MECLHRWSIDRLAAKSMTNNITSSTKTIPNWQLMAEFAVKSISGSEQSLTDRVMETARSISLKRTQLERIHEIMTQALNRARSGTQLAEHLCPVLIRIWSTETVVDGFGWGFFIVEKQKVEPQLTTGGAAYVVELYLYQEHQS
jgi:hypothetical protein